MNLGKFEILEEVGHGGFGTVYRANDTTLDRIVALKVLHDQYNSDQNFIESFKRETGDYPDSLEALIPKHLAELPEVRFSVFQPEITYRIRDGKSHLAIPSAMGDMFAQFEYNFETKVWMHHS